MKMASGSVHPRSACQSAVLSRAAIWLILATVPLLAGCQGQPTALAEPTVASPTLASSLPASTSTASPTWTPTLAPTPTLTPTATPTPSPVPTETPLPGVDLMAFETYRDGNGEIYLLDARTGALVNLTHHPADDRAPAWSPDGTEIAFESHRDGNWEIYVLDLANGALTRVTDNAAYDGAPAWSPDGTEIAFESYRDANLEIYVTPASGGKARRLTDDPAGAYGPAWSPDGQLIAFTAWQDGNKEVCIIPAEGGQVRNLTQNSADDEDPAWAPDGSTLAFVSWRDVDAATGNRNAEIYRVALAGGPAERLTENPWPDLDPAWDATGRLIWAAYEPGEPFETYDPYRPGDYHLFRATEAQPERLTGTSWDDRRPAPAPARVAALDGLADWLPATTPSVAAMPALAAGTLADVVQMPSVLAGYSGEPILVNELVTSSLVALQQDIVEATGWDLMHSTLGSWRNIDQVRHRNMYTYDYGYLSWHKTGRALDVALEYKVDGVDQMLVSREDLGDNVYWRMYLRTAKQDGTQGEPLKDNPWLFWWRIVPEAEPEAYDAGGKRLSIPGGYYVDITALAKRHGWERIASYAIQGDYHWSSDSNGTEYWHYERTDGLTWWEAMLQIYPPDKLSQYVGWQVDLGKLQSEAMIRSKGIPTPEP
jgi:TolB protein